MAMALGNAGNPRVQPPRDPYASYTSLSLQATSPGLLERDPDQSFRPISSWSGSSNADSATERPKKKSVWAVFDPPTRQTAPYETINKRPKSSKSSDSKGRRAKSQSGSSFAESHISDNSRAQKKSIWAAFDPPTAQTAPYDTVNKRPSKRRSISTGSANITPGLVNSASSVAESQTSDNSFGQKRKMWTLFDPSSPKTKAIEKISKTSPAIRLNTVDIGPASPKAKSPEKGANKSIWAAFDPPVAQTAPYDSINARPSAQLNVAANSDKSPAKNPPKRPERNFDPLDHTLLPIHTIPSPSTYSYNEHGFIAQISSLSVGSDSTDSQSLKTPISSIGSNADVAKVYSQQSPIGLGTSFDFGFPEQEQDVLQKQPPLSLPHNPNLGPPHSFPERKSSRNSPTYGHSYDFVRSTEPPARPALSNRANLKQPRQLDPIPERQAGIRFPAPPTRGRKYIVDDDVFLQSQFTPVTTPPPLSPVALSSHTNSSWLDCSRLESPRNYEFPRSELSKSAEPNYEEVKQLETDHIHDTNTATQSQQTRIDFWDLEFTDPPPPLLPEPLNRDSTHELISPPIPQEDPSAKRTLSYSLWPYPLRTEQQLPPTEGNTGADIGTVPSRMAAGRTERSGTPPPPLPVKSHRRLSQNLSF